MIAIGVEDVAYINEFEGFYIKGVFLGPLDYISCIVGWFHYW